MIVEIWSDYQCPFCYIGKRRFENALNQFANKAEVEVVYRSFELDPGAKQDNEMNIYELLSKKYGMSLEQAKAQNEGMVQQAKMEGLEYHLDTMVLTNTFDAHRLMHFAAVHGKEKEMNEIIFHANFTESKHIGQKETLVELAEQAGLNKADTAVMLDSTNFTAEVRADEKDGSQLGITGVPFFVINRKYGISGAQPTEVFVDMLEKVRAEENPLQILNEASTDDRCADGSCKVPEKP